MSVGVAVGAGIALSGAAVVNRALSTRRALKSAQGWPVAEARIVRSELVRNDTGTWASDVEYAFTVNSVPFAGQAIGHRSFVNVGFTDRYARRVVEAYPCGTAVLIRFDPDDPRAAFLDAELSSISNVPLLIGAVLLVVGAGIAIMEAL